MDQPALRGEPLAASGQDGRRRRRASSISAQSLWIAVAISVMAHLLVGGSLIVGMLPGRLRPAADTQGTVELLMVEKKGSGEPTPASRPTPPEPAPTRSEAQPPPRASQSEPQPQAPPVPRVVNAEAAPAGRPSTPNDSGEAVPVAGPPEQQDASAATPPADTKADDMKPREATQDTPKPADTTAAKQQPALTFNLDGTDSLTNAEVVGRHVIPASPDDRFRNRPPVFPREAEIRGEHGAVIVVIHVSETGQAVSADVAQTSGHALLDRAAVDAVLKWRFRPALKDGKSIPFDMPMRFVFEAE